jgi:hypothetical protein
LDLKTMLLAADLAYSYSDEDKAIIRQMSIDDRAGLTAALEADQLLPWIAYEHGLINEVPKGNKACNNQIVDKEQEWT